MPISRSSCESVNEARKHIMESMLVDFRHVLGPRDHEAINALLAATAPPSDVPRPDDMAELARMVAKELRNPRGIQALVTEIGGIEIARVSPDNNWAVRWHYYSLFASQFDNLTPSEIADVIQAEEAKRAAEWAGDI